LEQFSYINIFALVEVVCNFLGDNLIYWNFLTSLNTPRHSFSYSGTVPPILTRCAVFKVSGTVFWEEGTD
jgi:hypothetical protein